MAAQPDEQSLIDQTVAGLRRDDDDVYVAPGARQALPPDAAAALAERIDEADVGDVFVAVLPGEAEAADLDAVLQGVGEGVGREGTYVLVAGDQLRAGASDGTPFEAGEVPAIADDVVAEGGSTAVVLTRLVDELDAADTGPGAFLGPFLLLALVLGGLFAVVAAARRRRRQRVQAEEVRRVARDDLTELGSELYDLEQRLVMPELAPSAHVEYLSAIDEYTRARALLEAARRPADFAAVSAALAEGRFRAASARAALDGRPLPERRAPCFFDPRHGPSVRDVDWAPPGGAIRQVPACEADAQRVERGEEPAVRELELAGGRRPYWESPRHYGGWAGGYYGTGADWFSGFLLGSILSGGWGGGWGGGWHGGGWHGGHWGSGGHGDVGGGDFGGGFGGGDFGGGFGGGDFGG